MRLWSLHPRYLDAKGLIALWREALLAQKVLLGNTKGYKNHPQLNRFKLHPNPISAIGYYLTEIHIESQQRDYHFNHEKINLIQNEVTKIPVTQGQLSYELIHLQNKLRTRSPERLQSITNITIPEPHPLFITIPGNIEPWEKHE